MQDPPSDLPPEALPGKPAGQAADKPDRGPAESVVPAAAAGTAPDQIKSEPAEPADPSRAQQWLTAAKTGIWGAIGQASPAPGPRWAAFPPQAPLVKTKWALWLISMATLGVMFWLELVTHRDWTNAADFWAGYCALAAVVFAVAVTRLNHGPLSTWRWQAVIVAILMLTYGHWSASILLVVVFYPVLLLVGAYQEPAIAIGVGAVTSVLVILAVSPTALGVALVLATLVALPLYVGRLLGTRAASRRELSATKEALDVRSEHTAVLAERARIARDLHDVVAHQMSLIAIQAEAAELRTPDMPEATRHSLALIRGAASTALAETRSIVGLLRSDDAEAAERAPAPSVDSLTELVASAQRGGVQVSLEVHGEPRHTSAATGLAAYRIVQESLANANRHAPGQPVQIDLEWQDNSLAVTVLNGPDTPNGSQADDQRTSQAEPANQSLNQLPVAAQSADQPEAPAQVANQGGQVK